MDGAGKTSFLHYMDILEPKAFSIHGPDTAKWENLKIISWDLGGGEKYQQFMRSSYYHNTNGIIFVVDSQDRAYMEIVKAEFIKLLCEDEFKGVPILVLANKQDLKDVMSIDEIAKMLELNTIEGRKWCIHGCSATKKSGTIEALQWIQSQL